MKMVFLILSIAFSLNSFAQAAAPKVRCHMTLEADALKLRAANPDHPECVQAAKQVRKIVGAEGTSAVMTYVASLAAVGKKMNPNLVSLLQAISIAQILDMPVRMASPFDLDDKNGVGLYGRVGELLQKNVTKAFDHVAGPKEIQFNEIQ
jgi:hypothetical protein